MVTLHSYVIFWIKSRVGQYSIIKQSLNLAGLFCLNFLKHIQATDNKNKREKRNICLIGHAMQEHPFRRLLDKNQETICVHL